MKDFLFLSRRQIGCLAAAGMLVGCGSREPIPAGIDELPEIVRTLQGRWTAAESNAIQAIEVVIDGYTLRLRYQEEPDGPLFKKNVVIKSVDQQRRMLLIHDGTSAWPYALERQGGGAILTLEFYNSVESSWTQVRMKNTEGLYACSKPEDADGLQ